MTNSWKNRVTAAVATLAIAASMLPVNAFAADGDADPEPAAETPAYAEALKADESISVTGLQVGDSAKYYQIVTQDSETNAWKLSDLVDKDGDGFIDGTKDVDTWPAKTIKNSEGKDEEVHGLTVDDLIITNKETQGTEVITANIANAIAAALAENKATGTDMGAVGEGKNVLTAKVDAGLYMVSAVPGAKNIDTVYKPIFVSSDYDKDDGTNEYGPIEKDKSTYNDEEAVIFKASNLKIDKTAKEVDNTTGDTDSKGVGVGDTLEFTVKTPLVGYTKDYTDPEFKITDKLSDGLELVKDSIEVKVNEAVVSAGEKTFTLKATQTTGYTIEFAKDYLYDVIGAPEVVITYKAKVTSTASAQVNQMDNTVTLNFSNDPSDTTSKGELTDKTRHYTFDIDGDVLGGSEETGGDKDKHRTEEVQKVYRETTETVTEYTEATKYTGTNALKGAEFQLTDVTDANNPRIIEWDDNNVKSGVATEAGAKTKIISDDYGSIVMKGLDEGAYKLKETKAPQGYTPDPVEHTIVIAATYVDDAEGNKILESYTITVDGHNSKYTVELNQDETPKPKELIGAEGKVGKITVSSDAVTTLISNTKLGILPSTGGSGIYFYLGVGGAIAAGSAYLIHRTKKQEELLAK